MVSAARMMIMVLLGVTMSACGKNKEPMPKTIEQKTADDKSVRDNAVWGAQVQALDKAKGVQAAIDQQAEDARKKIDDSSK